MECRSPTLPPRSGSVVAMSISGWGDFCALVWKGWQIKAGRKTRDGVYALEYSGGGGLGKAMDVGTTLHRDQHGWFFLAACRREQAMAHYNALRLARSRPFA